jgi:hypothetical protein
MECIMQTDFDKQFKRTSRIVNVICGMAVAGALAILAMDLYFIMHYEEVARGFGKALHDVVQEATKK